MRKIASLIIVLLPALLSACSTTPEVKASAPVIQSVSASPSAVAPGGYVKVQIQALDPEGNSLSYQVGSAEAVSYRGNEVIIYQAPQTVGPAQVPVCLTNGRQDVFAALTLTVDNALPATTLTGGTVTLPAGKSFDFRTATISGHYFGSIDYEVDGEECFLTRSGDGAGNEMSYYLFSGGFVNLTCLKEYTSLNQASEVYNGYYYREIESRPNEGDEDKILAAGKIYGFFLCCDEGNYYGKLKVVSLSKENIVFDWIFQSVPGKKVFYD